MANLSTTERRKLGKARLDDNGGVCDMCGDAIGRYTKKCVFDQEHEKVYCNKNGCAEIWRESPRCGECKAILPEDSHKHEVGDLLLCGPCWVDYEPDGMTPVNVHEVPLPDWVASQLSNAEVQDIEAGPNKVFKAPYIFQIGRAFAGTIDVVATRAEMLEAFKGCAEHNRRMGEVRTESEIITVGA